jgi:hypothetical protein
VDNPRAAPLLLIIDVGELLAAAAAIIMMNG